MQADEILVEPKSLDLLRRTTLSNLNFEFFNLITKLESPEEIGDVNVVKCLMREDNSIITMARKSSSIASELAQMEYTSKVCGLFSCSSNLINKLASTTAQKIEKSESIEQMKVIEMGYNILGVRVNRNYLSVNTANDAISALNMLQNDTKQKNILNSYL